MKPIGIKRHRNAVDDYTNRFRRTHRKWRDIGTRAARRRAKQQLRK